MRVGPALLQFDRPKAGLGIWIFQSLHIPIQRLASRQERYRAAFYVVTDLLLQTTQENHTGLLHCVDLSLSRSTDHRDRNLHSLSLEVRHTNLSLHLSVNMYLVNVKSYTECHKDKKRI